MIYTDSWLIEERSESMLWDEGTGYEIPLQPLADNGGISLRCEEHFFHTRLRGARER